MEITLPNITDLDRDRFKSYTDKAIQGIKILESMKVKDLKKLVSGRDNKVREAFVNALGHDTNPSWITCQAASRLYDIDEIDSDQFDHITQN